MQRDTAVVAFQRGGESVGAARAREDHSALAAFNTTLSAVAAVHAAAREADGGATAAAAPTSAAPPSETKPADAAADEAATPAETNSPFEDEWDEHFDDASGHNYYLHRTTGEARRERPRVQAAAVTAGRGPSFDQPPGGASMSSTRGVGEFARALLDNAESAAASVRRTALVGRGHLRLRLGSMSATSGGSEDEDDDDATTRDFLGAIATAPPRFLAEAADDFKSVLMEDQTLSAAWCGRAAVFRRMLPRDAAMLQLAELHLTRATDVCKDDDAAADALERLQTRIDSAAAVAAECAAAAHTAATTTAATAATTAAVGAAPVIDAAAAGAVAGLVPAVSASNGAAWFTQEATTEAEGGGGSVRDSACPDDQSVPASSDPVGASPQMILSAAMTARREADVLYLEGYHRAAALIYDRALACLDAFQGQGAQGDQALLRLRRAPQQQGHTGDEDSGCPSVASAPPEPAALCSLRAACHLSAAGTRLLRQRDYGVALAHCHAALDAAPPGAAGRHARHAARLRAALVHEKKGEYEVALRVLREVRTF